MSPSLPPNANLTQLKHQAKDLLKAHRRGDPACCSVLRQLRQLADLSDAGILSAKVLLDDAQFALAMDYDFESWAKLKAHVKVAAAATKQQHLAFWQAMADGINSGHSVLQSLRQAQQGLQGTPMAPAIDRVADRVANGAAMFEAMRPEGAVFSPPESALAHAGEVGGYLAVIIERIAAAVSEDTLGPDAAAADRQDVRYWRLFALLISSGVPILQALALVRDAVADPPLKRATEEIHQAIGDRKSLADGMRECPDVFTRELWRAIEQGEFTGALEVAAQRVADALAADDLSSLEDPDWPDYDELVVQREELDERRHVNGLILQAYRKGADRIVLEPPGLDGWAKTWLRVAAQDWRGGGWSDGSVYEKIVNRIKVMAQMKATNEPSQAEGLMELEVSGESLNVHVAIEPAEPGPRVILRLERLGADGP